MNERQTTAVDWGFAKNVPSGPAGVCRAVGATGKPVFARLSPGAVICEGRGKARCFRTVSSDGESRHPARRESALGGAAQGRRGSTVITRRFKGESPHRKSHALSVAPHRARGQFSSHRKAFSRVALPMGRAIRSAWPSRGGAKALQQSSQDAFQGGSRYGKSHPLSVLWMSGRACGATPSPAPPGGRPTGGSPRG